MTAAKARAPVTTATVEIFLASSEVSAIGSSRLTVSEDEGVADGSKVGKSLGAKLGVIIGISLGIMLGTSEGTMLGK